MKKIFFIFISTAIILPIVHFVFLSPFYDRAGEWLFLFNQGYKKISKENISSIKQPIISPSNQFSKIVIDASVNKISKIRLKLSDKKAYGLREEDLFITPGKKIIWEFPRVSYSQNKAFQLQIDIPPESQNHIQFIFFNTDPQNAIVVNNEQISGLSLAMHTESKFLTPLEKIQTFVARIKTYKPPLIQIIFFPIAALYVIFFAISLWYGIKIILSEESMDKK